MTSKDSNMHSSNHFPAELHGDLQPTGAGPGDEPSVPSDLINKQTDVSADLLYGLKAHAAVNRKLLVDVFSDAITEFLDYRAQLVKAKKTPMYVVSPKDGERLNVRLTKSLSTQANKAAEKDRVAARRLVFTALVYYATQHGIIRGQTP